MKKTISLFLAVLMCVLTFSACGKDKDKEAAEAESSYSGILTKLRLGMNLNKIISLQDSATELYYETDTEIWSVNPDTDLMEIRNVIPADNAYYYADDSIITYYFTHDDKQDDYFLNAFMEEVTCVIDRKTAEAYFNKKKDELAKKYGVTPKGTLTGTEGVDQTLVYVETYTCNTFTVELTMNLTYDTVNDVDDYYATFFSIKLSELANKTAVPLESSKE
jgi:hypothetical protein